MKYACVTILRTKTRNIVLKRSQSSLFYSSLPDLDAGYVPNKVEQQNIDSEYFKPPLQCPKAFSLILPPPNITGNLHLGHALTCTIEDIIVKWKQMQGVETVWIPGLDHAGIATQIVVEKKLWGEEKETRHNIGRDKFVRKIWDWKKEKVIVIESQLKRLGLSLNWDRGVFTMDPEQGRIVSDVFVKLFDRGLIYRQDSLVNWSCYLRSAISDIEVDHVEIDGTTAVNIPGYEKPIKFGRMIHFAYRICDSDEEIVIATTRPETILGDVAVAVHPSDNRYSNLIGKYVHHPFRKEAIPIIADEFVDMNYGTGAVKLTPAHDNTDFSVAKKHSLRTLQVFDEKGLITDVSKDFQGLRRFEVRNLIIDRLDTLNLLRDIKEHKTTVPICSRSHDVIELLMRPQWFVRCEEMAKRAMDAVKEKRLIIEPERFEGPWFNWLENIHDWCISRQLWWGHRIPAYLCKTTDGTERWISAPDLNSAQEKAQVVFGMSSKDIHLEQDGDVLDTWFSSVLLPFSVFCSSNNMNDFSSYYPLSLMETGHDILFFWVARMVMLGQEITGQLPFKKVMLHGIICDSQGRKMSKSLGNVIAPEYPIDGITLQDLHQAAQDSQRSGILSEEEFKRTLQVQKKMFPDGIPECGADALRFTLVSHNVKGHFINFEIQECYTNKLFCNKIWQATKFARIWYDKVCEVQGVNYMNPEHITPIDKWILSRYSNLIQTMEETLQTCDLYQSTLALKNFLYYELCDVYLEAVKRGLREVGSKTAAGHCWTLLTVLEGGLRALHPFMPYLTLHLHQRIPSIGEKERCYPKEAPWRDEELENTVDDMLQIVKGIRRLKKLFNVNKKHNAEVRVQSDSPKHTNFKEIIQDLSRTKSVVFQKEETVSVPEFLSVKDVLCNNVIIHLRIPEELRKSVKVDQPKLAKQKEKLLQELDKLKMTCRSVVDEDNVATNPNTSGKRIGVLEEKIQRIDYLLRIL